MTWPVHLPKSGESQALTDSEREAQSRVNISLDALVSLPLRSALDVIYEPVLDDITDEPLIEDGEPVYQRVHGCRLNMWPLFEASAEVRLSDLPRGVRVDIVFRGEEHEVGTGR